VERISSASHEAIWLEYFRSPLTFTISIFVLGIAAFFGGLWLNRVGPRVVALTGGFLYGLGVFLLSAMAALALLLSAVGIFALVANIVAQKTREIGIRIALGSTIRQAMVNIGGPGVRSSALGLILGLVLRWMRLAFSRRTDTLGTRGCAQE